MLAALRQHPDVGHVEVFAPFAYAGLLSASVRWDVLLIEGWTGPVRNVIHTLRRACPDIVVVHWCLDTYPDLDTVRAR